MELGNVANERQPLADAGESSRDALQVALRKDCLDPGEVRTELGGLLQASARRAFKTCKGRHCARLTLWLSDHHNLQAEQRS